MTETQKLREALRELMSIVSIHQKATRNNFAWAEMAFAREALALPTEPERPQNCGTSFCSCIECVMGPSQPVGELPDDIGSLADYFGDLAQQKADLDASRGVSMPVSYYASTVVAAALAWQARADLSAGDAVDAARYRWLADCNNYYEAITLMSDGSLTEDALGKAIDAAMRKEKP